MLGWFDKGAESWVWRVWHESNCRLAQVRRPVEAPMEVSIAGLEDDIHSKMTPIPQDEPDEDVAAHPPEYGRVRPSDAARSHSDHLPLLAKIRVSHQ